MFTAVVAELQILGAHLADALRLANAIDFSQGLGHLPCTAKAFALNAWEEDQEGLKRIKEESEWEDQQEALLNVLYIFD